MFNLPKSQIFAGLEWTGPRLPYPEPDIKGDTYPITWADDNELHTSSGDPLWGESIDGLDSEKFCGDSPAADWKIHKTNHMNAYTGWGGDGPKPTGMICVDGILYLAFQNLLRQKPPAYGLVSQHGSDAHIVYSTSKGGIWTPHLDNIKEPMFPGHKFGGPAFVQHGKNNADAVDSFVYAISSDSWDNGSNLRLGRVPKDAIGRREAWEWVGAWDAERKPYWTRSLDDAIPVLSLLKTLGCPEMVYLPKFKRYLLLTWRLHGDFSPTLGTDLLVFESERPWGPFNFVHYEESWEGEINPYCPRVPMKWMSDDNLSGHLLFSGSWNWDTQKTVYRAHTRPFKLRVES